MAREVVVYTRTGCMFCQQVKDMLTEAKIDFRTEQVEDRLEQDRLCERHGALSFPLVLIGQHYIGSFTHIVKLASESRLVDILSDDPSVRESVPAAMPKPVRPLSGGLSGFAALGEYYKKRDGK
ncbi:MAG: glutaredoxin domain-containing protein [Polyangiaceae bacterium]